MAIGNQKVDQDWEAVSQRYGGAGYVLPFTAELEQQDHELLLFCPLQRAESDPYQLSISSILADIFSLGDGKTKGGKKKEVKTKEGKPPKHKTVAADKALFKQGFRLHFRNKGEF